MRSGVMWQWQEAGKIEEQRRTQIARAWRRHRARGDWRERWEKRQEERRREGSAGEKGQKGRIGQAHEAQQKGSSALATRHHEEASRLREEMEQQGRERDEGQQARSTAVDTMDTSSTREATGTESGAGTSGQVAQGRGGQQVGVSEHGMEATRESKEKSAREQRTWGKGETQEGGEEDVSWRESRIWRASAERE